MQRCVGGDQNLPTRFSQQNRLPGVSPAVSGIRGDTLADKVPLKIIIFVNLTEHISSLSHSYEILAASAIPKGFMDGKQACCLMVNAKVHKMSIKMYVHSEVFVHRDSLLFLTDLLSV